MAFISRKQKFTVAIRTVSQGQLAKDTILAKGDIQLRKRDISQYRSGVFEAKHQLIGMVLKRSLAQGSVFTPREVAPKQLVHRGEPVIIMAVTKGMTVRVRGRR